MNIPRSEISAQTPQMRGFVLYGDAQSRYVLKILSIGEKTANPSFCDTGFFLLEWRRVSLIGTDVLAPYPRSLNAFNDLYFSAEISKSPTLFWRGLTGQPELVLVLQAERSALGLRRAERIADENTQVRPRSLNAFNDLNMSRAASNSPAQGRPDAHCAERQTISWSSSLKPNALFVRRIRLRVVFPHAQHRAERRGSVECIQRTGDGQPRSDVGPGAL